jgi:hypothetical protein
MNRSEKVTLPKGRCQQSKVPKVKSLLSRNEAAEEADDVSDSENWSPSEAKGLPTSKSSTSKQILNEGDAVLQAWRCSCTAESESDSEERMNESFEEEGFLANGRSNSQESTRSRQFAIRSKKRRKYLVSDPERRSSRRRSPCAATWCQQATNTQ